mmetsp:Transcript_38899/g.126496  ORF Transcript_38899/g.126496 Transcript_38899/m.126496 type:complete len:306 (+) Transcript_38899:692-1609(+)
MAVRHVFRASLKPRSRSPTGRGSVAAEEEAASAPTHGEASSCRTVARSRGSGARRSRTTARASGETEAHSVLLQPSYLWARMARLSARSSAMPAGSKGWYPTRRRYRITPSAHRSTSEPNSSPRSCSGDMYAMVPTTPRSGGAPSPVKTLSPKSQSLTSASCSPLTSSRFSGLRSRWHTPSAWRWAIASPTWRKRAEACCSEYAPYCTSRSNSSPPPTYSITSAQPPSVSYTPRSSTMLRWRPARRMISTSRRTSDGGRFAAPPPPDLLLRLDAICFTATTSPVSRCRARRTVAKWPRPISSPSS